MQLTTSEANTWSGRELVPDEETARQIGMAILTAYYGRQVVSRFEPYRVTRKAGSWFIVGETEAHRQARRENEAYETNKIKVIIGGGMPGISLSAQDARVETISLQK